MNKQKQGLDLIKRCLNGGGHDYNGGEIQTASVTIRDVGKFQCTNNYDLNLDSVMVLEFQEYTTDASEWDGQYNDFAIFEFDKGFGIATRDGNWDPTFGSEDLSIEIYESKDWDMFYKFSLTDEVRSKINDLALEMVLLRETTADSGSK